ncbi:LysR family transcriptional regulator [Heyndrickxia oleronia]|uniref:LysR family transcriptional regulator n=1 Tax=Heyndrickxia oleronia TaxID=38875 RepID=A0A8E2IBS1_9BACI|nr:LysR family transcriptional regulator [Heyndrickxia oleronia]OJH17091.1 LysR family transcriptional regulator [Bacillus obstructivus]MBU5212318.1 LysR family transcriptional regulator [Heyndrickxia oleronia]MCI1589396.1 LysR family transcriptional regulator [Heyndrickxia oleronia]MCI1612626.1 LysR family transcriptional regulator [Heyndrickxia oleronia]MCI1743854.1 LysR family transcriptional regulator [Heyndrickxia oleronia]
MELKWLHTFIAAARHENFRKTAEELFISQPTVTVHIKLLEEEIGSSLFEREGRKIILTEAGKKFIPIARTMIGVYEEGKAEMDRFRQGYTQKLILAMSPLIAESIMPYVLKKFMLAYPNIEISVQVLDSIKIPEAVLSGKVDLGLSRSEIKNADLTCRPLYEDPVILVVPHDGRDSETAPPLDAEELLMNHYLITHNHPEYWDGLLRSLRLKIPTIKTMAVSQVHVTRRFIMEGLGISFLPSSTVRRELLEGRLLEAPCPFLHLPVAKTYAILKYESEKETQFLQFLSQFRL